MTSALLIVESGSYALNGRKLTGAVDSIDKLNQLIDWAIDKGVLRSQPGRAARLWVCGAAWQPWVPLDQQGPAPTSAAVGQALGALVAYGWQLAATAAGYFTLTRAGQRPCQVEVVIDPDPWFARSPEGVDVERIGRGITAWVNAVGVLPETDPALSAAVVVDQMMATRSATRREAAVVEAATLLPPAVQPELCVQPEWVANPETVEDQLACAVQLTRLAQHCPLLASAGMLTLGWGNPATLQGSAAKERACAAKPDFGLWRVVVPPAAALECAPQLPPPHPQMRHSDDPAVAWLSTEDLVALARDPRDGGAGIAVEDLEVDAAVVWPRQTRILEAWATKWREALRCADPRTQAVLAEAAESYLSSLGDWQRWNAFGRAHHYQPAWLAAMSAHTRARGRRVAMRISREYRRWPLCLRGTEVIYAVDNDETTGRPTELADTHDRLGRFETVAQGELTDAAVLSVLSAPDEASTARAFFAIVPAAPRAPAIGVSAPTQEAAHSDPMDPVEVEDDSDRPQSTSKASAVEGGSGQEAQRESASGKGIGGVAAAVLDVDGLWLPDGTKVDLADPVTHVGQVVELAYRYELGFRSRANSAFAEPGQVWMTTAMCQRMGIAVEEIAAYDPVKSLRQITEGIEFVDHAAAQGWRFGGQGDADKPRLGVWTRVFRDGDERKGVLVVLIPGLNDALKYPIVADDPSPGELACRIQRFAEVMKYPLQMAPGMTAIDLMFSCRPRSYTWEVWKNEVLAPSTTEVPYTFLDIERDFNWTRSPTAEEAQLRFAHAYDRGASYPAAIAGLELPIGAAEHHRDGLEFDAKLPGYWLITIPEAADWRLPHLLNPAGLRVDGPRWVCTPRLNLAVELGYEPEVHEAWVWRRHGRVLNGWYERFRDASNTLNHQERHDAAVLKQTKSVRNIGIGMLGSELIKGRPGYSPERRWHILSKASANIIRAIHKTGERTGRWPVAVQTDTIVYLSDDPDPRSAWPGEASKLGTGFGQYKPDGSAMLADHREFLTGDHYRGKADLIKPADWVQTLKGEN